MTPPSTFVTHSRAKLRFELVDEQGEHVGRQQVARLMRIVSICSVTRRKFCRTTRRRQVGLST